MSRYIDAEALKETHYNFATGELVPLAWADIENAPHIDIVRCKECASYCGDGNKCLWGLLTVDMGYCHHGYRGGDCITKSEPQTEREGE